MKVLSSRNKSMRIGIFGAGKVGCSLYKALRCAGVHVRLMQARASVELKSITQMTVFILAVRDRAIQEIAERLVKSTYFPPSAVVVHCAGALDASVLDSIRLHCAGVAQMHPMISFADTKSLPFLGGGHVHVQGDIEAVRRVKRLCRKIGLVPRTFSQLDPILYHAAAGLVANGAAALAAAGSVLLQQAGVNRNVIPLMLGPLLRSVADNITALGLPGALTGPVRRGDAQAVARHLEILKLKAPDLAPLYLESVRAQVPMAEALSEGSHEQYERIRQILNSKDP